MSAAPGTPPDRPGITVPFTAAGRSGAIHVPSAKTLTRFRGSVVPSIVFESQGVEPLFLSSM